MEKKILVVDDEEKIAEVVGSYLEHNGYRVDKVYSGREALRLFEKENHVLIILDLMLPDMSGEEICRSLRKKSRVPIMMLTAKVEEEDILKGLDIGADDYITKPFSPRELVARVNALLRRVSEEPVPLANVLEFNNGDLTINHIKYEVRKKGKLVNLTPNEYKILMTLIKYPAKVFTRDELISIALGGDFDGFDRTVDTHIKNIRQKIETDPKNPCYILTVYGIGYRFGGE
ncbi:MAG: response regulator transcription factor [Bacillota bacterium]|jgi:DNA-binding response OmpR family regulator